MRCSYCKKEEKGHDFSPKHMRITKGKKILYFCKPKHYKLYEENVKMKPKKKPKAQKVYNYVNFEDLALNIETSNEIDYQEYEEDIRELEDEFKLKGYLKGRKL